MIRFEAVISNLVGKTGFMIFFTATGTPPSLTATTKSMLLAPGVAGTRCSAKVTVPETWKRYFRAIGYPNRQAPKRAAAAAAIHKKRFSMPKFYKK